MKLIENKYSIKTIKQSVTPVVVEQIAKKEKKPRSDALIKAQKKYYEKNKQKITERQTIYNESYSKLTHRCKCGDMVSNSSKYKHIISDRHIRRLQNIKAGRPAGTTPGEEYIDCPCGGHYIYKQRHQHFRTKKHIKFVEEEYEQDKLAPELTQAKLREQLRRMLLGEGLDTISIDRNPNVNKSDIKEI